MAHPSVRESERQGPPWEGCAEKQLDSPHVSSHRLRLGRGRFIPPRTYRGMLLVLICSCNCMARSISGQDATRPCAADPARVSRGGSPHISLRTPYAATHVGIGLADGFQAPSVGRVETALCEGARRRPQPDPRRRHGDDRSPMTVTQPASMAATRCPERSAHCNCRPPPRAIPHRAPDTPKNTPGDRRRSVYKHKQAHTSK